MKEKQGRKKAPEALRENCVMPTYANPPPPLHSHIPWKPGKKCPIPWKTKAGARTIATAAAAAAATTSTTSTTSSSSSSQKEDTEINQFFLVFLFFFFPLIQRKKTLADLAFKQLNSAPPTKKTQFFFFFFFSKKWCKLTYYLKDMESKTERNPFLHSSHKTHQKKKHKTNKQTNVSEWVYEAKILPSFLKESVPLQSSSSSSTIVAM